MSATRPRLPPRFRWVRLSHWMRLPRLLRLRGASHALLAVLGLATPLESPSANVAAVPTPAISRLADIRARLLAPDERLAGQAPIEPPSAAPDGPMAQWFNWPNWSNWANWNNWNNWNNWVKWSKF